MFCAYALGEKRLPPTSDCLKLHAKRANYQARIHKLATSSQTCPSCPSAHGWLVNNDSVSVRWMTLDPAPKELTRSQSVLVRNQSVTPSSVFAATQLYRAQISAAVRLSEQWWYPGRNWTVEWWQRVRHFGWWIKCALAHLLVQMFNLLYKSSSLSNQSINHISYTLHNFWMKYIFFNSVLHFTCTFEICKPYQYFNIV